MKPVDNTDVREKDAISAATMRVETTLHHRLSGRTLFDQLGALRQKFGYFEEIQNSKTFGGIAVTMAKDYLDGTTRGFPAGTAGKAIDPPSSNEVRFILEDNTIITARLSGTGPKIKFHASCRSLPGTPLVQARREVAIKIGTISRATGETINGA